MFHLQIRNSNASDAPVRHRGPALSAVDSGPTKIKISSAYTAKELLPVVDQLSAAWRTLPLDEPSPLAPYRGFRSSVFRTTAREAAARFSSLKAYEKPRKRAKFPESNNFFLRSRPQLCSLEASNAKYTCGRPSGAP